MALMDRATNIAEQLIDNKLLRENPIILIAHSLGGLIVKQVLRHLEGRQNIDDRCKQLVDNICLVVFMGTPHSGSRIATWGDRFSIVFRPSSLSKDLVFADHHLTELNRWYRTFSDKKFKHIVMVEMEKTRYIGKVVDQVSSDPGIPDARIVPIDANHSSICKPTDRNSEIYVIIKSEIEHVLERRAIDFTKSLDNKSKFTGSPAIVDQTERAVNRLQAHKSVLADISSQKDFKVLLCGPSLSETERSDGARLNSRLKSLFESEGFDVILGENDGLKNIDFSKHGNSIVGEFEFVKSSCNAVVIIAETIGAWCELSLFSWQIANDPKARNRAVDLIVLISDEHITGNEFFRAGTYSLVNSYGKADFVCLAQYDPTILLERLRGRRLIYATNSARKPRKHKQ
jgi:hypothetical protein